MKLSLRGIVAAGVAALAMAGTAHAASLSYSTDFSSGVGSEWTINAPEYQQDPGILGEGSNSGPASYTLTVNSPGASSSTLNGTLSFDLLGFRTIDGANCCTDVFQLFINGSDRYDATFAMGGGGAEFVISNPDGAFYTVPGGQDRYITIPFTALAGANTFTFYYGNLQGFGDEAFGLDNVSLSADVAAAVPEPATWALIMFGVGAAGAALRRRRTLALA